MEPAPVERARCLIRFAKHCGSPLHQFTVLATKHEGFELLDWLRETADPKQLDVKLLDEAIMDARAADDPWRVIPEFRLFGMEVMRCDQLS